MGTNQMAYQRLYSAMEEGWAAIPQAKIDHLIRSMNERVESVRLARGWHTRFWNKQLFNLKFTYEISDI
jgi:hypothetical protein